MYGYDISNEVSPKVVSTSVQQNWMRSHDLTKLRLIKNFPAKTSHKTENQNFSSKFQFWYDNFMFRCLCSKPANTQWILCSKWFFQLFFLSIECKELLNVKELLLRRYRHQICKKSACPVAGNTTKSPMTQKIHFFKVWDIVTTIEPRKKKHQTNVSSALKAF